MPVPNDPAAPPSDPDSPAPRTLFAKLWDRHVVTETPGHPSVL